MKIHKQLKILVVEDNRDLATNIQDILREKGYDPSVAFDGESATELCRRQPFDLVLMDYKLPDTDGISLQKDLAEIIDADFIVVTGHASVESAAEAVYHRRIVGYETKPLDMERLLAFIRQIAERRRAQKEIKELEKRLQKARRMESLGNLAGGIAHEFNNILAVVIGNAELALEDIPEGNPAKDFVNQILAGSLQATNSVKRILKFLQKVPSRKSNIRIGPVVSETLKLIETNIPKTIALRRNILCESERVLANPSEIGHVLVQLCSNAALAMEGGGGTLEVGLEKIELDEFSSAQYEDLRPGDYVRLTVEDSGGGIEPKILDRIFEPYFTTWDMSERAGMGLAEVFGTVKHCGGAVRAENRIGEGARFEVLLPVIEGPGVYKKEAAFALPAGSERILLIDDEASLVKTTKLTLERLGYRVTAKTDVDEALRLFQKEPESFDLLITDMAMPAMAGDRFAAKALGIRPDIPVLLCTGHSDYMDEEKAREIGIKTFVLKPLVKTRLAKAVRDALGTP